VLTTIGFEVFAIMVIALHGYGKPFALASSRTPSSRHEWRHSDVTLKCQSLESINGTLDGGRKYSADEFVRAVDRFRARHSARMGRLSRSSRVAHRRCHFISIEGIALAEVASTLPVVVMVRRDPIRVASLEGPGRSGPDQRLRS
jgi:hypothetical protein